MCLYVCLSVTGFTIEIYGFIHSLLTFLAHATIGTINPVMEDLGDRRRRLENESKDIEELFDKGMKDRGKGYGDKANVYGSEMCWFYNSKAMQLTVLCCGFPLFKRYDTSSYSASRLFVVTDFTSR